MRAIWSKFSFKYVIFAWNYFVRNLYYELISVFNFQLFKKNLLKISIVCFNIRTTLSDVNETYSFNNQYKFQYRIVNNILLLISKKRDPKNNFIYLELNIIFPSKKRMDAILRRVFFFKYKESSEGSQLQIYNIRWKGLLAIIPVTRSLSK